MVPGLLRPGFHLDQRLFSHDGRGAAAAAEGLRRGLFRLEGLRRIRTGFDQHQAALFKGDGQIGRCARRRGGDGLGCSDGFDHGLDRRGDGFDNHRRGLDSHRFGDHFDRRFDHRGGFGFTGGGGNLFDQAGSFGHRRLRDFGLHFGDYRLGSFDDGLDHRGLGHGHFGGRSLDGGEPTEIAIVADKDKVTQVVSNLLSNVLTHTPEGTECEVAVGVIGPDPLDESTESTEPRFAVVEIRDHGPGVKPADAEHLFERFYRTDSSRTRASGGSGLGMAIVAAIMGSHGGTARVRETDGGGLTVQLMFPLAG